MISSETVAERCSIQQRVVWEGKIKSADYSFFRQRAYQLVREILRESSRKTMGARVIQQEALWLEVEKRRKGRRDGCVVVYPDSVT